MEIYHSTHNPKNWAHHKRSQRYSTPLERRKAHPNGQVLRTMYDECYFTKNSQLFTFQKSIRSPGIDGETSSAKTVFGHTPFERDLNLGMVNNTEYSLNRHKKWEKIAEILKDVDCDEKCTITRGKGADTKWGDREVEITKIGYFDLDEMKIQTDRLQRDQQRYDRDLNDDVQYIEDKHFATIQRKERHNKLRRWKEAQCVKPRVITQHSSFVPVKAITASSVRSGCKVRMATVRSFGKRSYWSPRRQHDDRDFIQIDLGKDLFVEAISTRGRVLRRNSDYEPMATPSDNEFVKKYRVKIRGDITSSDTDHDLSVDDEWIDLGVSSGNTDCETEKVTKLTLPFSKSEGVVCRYIRIYPLMFVGAKAMRVGVYGHTPFGREQKEDDVMEREEGMDKGSGEMIKDKSVPAAIITIKQPAVNHKRGCFAVPGQAEGVYASRWGRCWDDWKDKERRCARKEFRNQVKKLRRVRDYDLDHSLICYW